MTNEDRKKVLLVDDSSTMLVFERLMLGPELEIATATNGKQALEAVQRERPDLILLDVMMPVMNGMECLAQLKSAPQTMDIPVIMVTTRGETENIERCFALGCDDFVTKPINRGELMSKVQRYLG